MEAKIMIMKQQNTQELDRHSNCIKMKRTKQHSTSQTMCAKQDKTYELVVSKLKCESGGLILKVN